MSRSEPSTAEGQAIRARLVRRHVDRDVLRVLDTIFFWDDNEQFTLFDTIRSLRFTSEEGVPLPEIVFAVEEALSQRRLSPSQKNKFFSILGWYFECPRCGKDWTADRFENTVFYLWQSDRREEPMLQSRDPCTSCQQQPERNSFELRNEYYTW
ncbi:hypothetical protein GGI35DRAFT_57476 [Trichoderma velutinum]